MAHKELEKMSLDDLKALRKDVDLAIEEFGERQRREALKALEAVAKDHGMSIDDIVSGPGKKRKKSKVPAKYRNPADPGQTWSGRGRQPQWFKDATDAGAKPESLMI